MIELITVKNPTDNSVEVLWDDVKYVCKAGAQVEIPGRILYKFLDMGCIRLDSRMQDTATPPNPLLRKAPTGGEIAPPEQGKIDAPAIRQMAKEDAAEVVTKRIVHKPVKKKGRPRKI